MINLINCSIPTNNNTTKMYILSKSSSIHYYFKRRLSRHLNFTDDDIISSRTLDMSYEYNTIKDISRKYKRRL